MHDFTPVHAALGGALIASSLAIMLIATGQIAGVAGVVAATLRGSFQWHVWFVVGVLGVGAVFELAAPATFDTGSRVPLWLVAISGVLVGIGTRASNGCTSGHGLCGMSRLSRRSIVATISFFAVGVVTATLVGALVRHG